MREALPTLDPAPSNIVVSDQKRLTIGAGLPEVARKVVASSVVVRGQEKEDNETK